MMPRALALTLILCLAPVPCLAYSTPDVDLRDVVYHDIDKLVAAGLVDAIIYGQRPYSRMEIARITVEATESLERRRGQGGVPEPLAATLEGILERMGRRFAPEVRALTEGEQPGPFAVRPLHEVRLTYEYTNSEPAHFIADNGLGAIDGARIQPFAYYRQGRELRRGSQLALETVSSLRVSRYFAFLVEPRFYFPLSSGAATTARLLQLYGRFNPDNFSVTFGRKSVAWGQGEFGGEGLSINALPLDLVMVTNDRPAVLPYFLSFLGPAKGSFFYADMGDTYRHPGAYLVGIKLSVEPHPNFEFGLSNLVLGGGEGGPRASFGERVEDVFSFDTSQPISNRIGGFEARLRVPSLRGASFYLELMFDDPNEDLEVLFTDETAYLFGIYLPIVDPAGRLSLRAEYRRTGVRFYRGPFPYVRKGDILGDPLGPDAEGGYLTGVYDLSPDFGLRLQLAAEWRGSDTYRVANLDNFSKEVVRDGPRERRLRAIGGACYRVLGGLSLEGALGYERVSNFDFREGSDRNNYYSRLGLTYSFDYGAQ